MTRYIKANPKVAEYLHLENERNRVKDGNFLLWQADMLAFGLLTELPAIMTQIGAIALQAHEAREEQDGVVIRPLPVATDPRFVIEPASYETDQPEQMDKEAAGTEDQTVGETADSNDSENGQSEETAKETNTDNEEKEEQL